MDVRALSQAPSRRPAEARGMIEDKFEAAVTWLIENWHVIPRPWSRTVRQQFDMDFSTSVKVMAEARRRGGCK